MKKWKLWSGILVIFISGIVIGFSLGGVFTKKAVEHMFSGEHRGSREFIMNKLTRELDLTSSQREYVEKIVCRTHAELFQMRQSHVPEIRAIIESGITEMKQQLNPEQSKKLDEFYEKAKKRWGHSRERAVKNGQADCE